MSEMYEINRRLSGAYIVDAQAVEKLASAIEEAIGTPPSLTLEFTNNRKVGSSSATDINDSYVGTARLESVSLYASLGRKTCSLQLGWMSSAPIYIDIKLPRLEAKELENRIENIVISYQTWYHSIFKLKQTSMIFTVFLGIITIFAIIATITFTNWADTITKNVYAVYFYKTFLLIAILNAITDFFVPSISFNIGLSGKIMRRNHAIISFVIFVIFVGIAINIISDIVKPYILPPGGS